MSRFVDKVATDEITLANGDRVWVRQRLTAEEEALMDRDLVRLHADLSSGQVKVEEIAWHFQTVRICEAYVTGWDFKDDDGQPAAFDRALIRQLDGATVKEIATAIDAIQIERRQQFQKKALGS